MSFRVMIIPEDFTRDQYVLKPIIRAMFEAVGRNAQVEVCMNPRLRGVSQALDWGQVRAIVDRYRGMFQCFLLVVDRDGDPHRRIALDNLERAAAEAFPGLGFLAENAWQEVEVWCLAGYDLEGAVWSEVRAERDPKERYFLPLARQHGLLDAPGQGRRQLAEAAARRYERLRVRCPEDLGALEQRVRALP